MLRPFLAGRDVPCPGCGYNVRDLPNDVCPECGQRLVLSVRLGEPRQAALIAGLIGLSAGAGLGGLLLIYAAIVLLMHEGPPDWDKFVLVNLGGLAVHGAGIGVWLRKWNRIRRLRPGARWTLVVACWAMPLVFVVIFAWTIR